MKQGIWVGHWFHILAIYGVLWIPASYLIEHGSTAPRLEQLKELSFELTPLLLVLVGWGLLRRMNAFRKLAIVTCGLILCFGLHRLVTGLHVPDQWDMRHMGGERSSAMNLIEGSCLLVIFGFPLIVLILPKARQAFRGNPDETDVHGAWRIPSRYAGYTLTALFLCGISTLYEISIVQVRTVMYEKRWNYKINKRGFLGPLWISRVAYLEPVREGEKYYVTRWSITEVENNIKSEGRRVHVAHVRQFGTTYYPSRPCLLGPPSEPIGTANIQIIRKDESTFIVPRRISQSTLMKAMGLIHYAKDADDLSRRLEELLPPLK